MSLYVVMKRNPYFRPGTYLEKFDDGFQKAVVEQDGNRLKVLTNKGLILDPQLLMPYVMKVQKRGLDMPHLRPK